MVLALKPLHDFFGIKKINIVSMQAISGAGFPGVASLDIVDNIIPYIENEESKVEKETLKILGTLEETQIVKPDITISASCNRVNVHNGHLECISVELEEKTDIDTIKEIMRTFSGIPQELNLPTAPMYPIIVMDKVDRPQPRLDRNMGNGMSCVVGGIREDKILDFKFLVLGHNTIRGAAGAGILNAELMYELNCIKG